MAEVDGDEMDETFFLSIAEVNGDAMNETFFFLWLKLMVMKWT